MSNPMANDISTDDHCYLLSVFHLHQEGVCSTRSVSSPELPGLSDLEVRARVNLEHIKFISSFRSDFATGNPLSRFLGPSLSMIWFAHDVFVIVGRRGLCGWLSPLRRQAVMQQKEMVTLFCLSSRRQMLQRYRFEALTRPGTS
jgi:hypothetical protein